MNNIQFQYSELEQTKSSSMEEESQLRKLLAFGAVKPDRRKRVLETMMNLKN
jgi:hypothetical protein